MITVNTEEIKATCGQAWRRMYRDRDNNGRWQLEQGEGPLHHDVAIYAFEDEGKNLEWVLGVGKPHEKENVSPSGIILPSTPREPREDFHVVGSSLGFIGGNLEPLLSVYRCTGAGCPVCREAR